MSEWKDRDDINLNNGVKYIYYQTPKYQKRFFSRTYENERSTNPTKSVQATKPPKRSLSRVENIKNNVRNNLYYSFLLSLYSLFS